MGAVVAMLAAVAIGDYFFQYRQWYERQKMSLQEIKDEFKQSEGDPHIKGKHPADLRQQRMKKRMMAAVPKARVIITNPTHYAVALSYERGMPAPICVAKGVDNIALKIREIAGKHDIPIVENVPLARALHATVEIDEEIPVEHYHAVAEIIGYVMGLKRGFSGRRRTEGTGAANHLEMTAIGQIAGAMDLRLQARFRHSGAGAQSALRARSRVTCRRQACAAGMTAESDSDPPTEPLCRTTSRRGASGSIVLVLLVAGAIVAVAVALMTIGRAQAQPYILGAAGAAGDGRPVQPVRLRRRHHPLRRSHRRRSGDEPDRRSRL